MKKIAAVILYILAVVIIIPLIAVLMTGGFLVRPAANGAFKEKIRVYVTKEDGVKEIGAKAKLASRYSVDNVFDFIELTKDSAIYEMPIAPAWVSKSIIQLDIRRKYHINILAIKQNDIIQPLPNAEYVFTGSEHIIIIGHNTDVEKFMKKINQQIQ